MSRMIVVSNRVSMPGTPVAGGLAVSLMAALEATGGIWVGWSGNLGSDHSIHVHTSGKITYVTTDLSQADHDAYYNGFANRALWPLLHSRADLMLSDHNDKDTYQAVNERFAGMLAGIAQDEDIIWIHDYHLIPMAAALRNVGVQCRIGFFLHVPLPSPDLLATLPAHREFFSNLLEYDLIGFQTDGDVAHFCAYARGCLEAAQIAPDLLLASSGKMVRVGAFPIGIDATAIARMAEANQHAAEVVSLRRSLGGQLLAIGVDRLDYSKGLPERFAAVGDYLAARSADDPLLNYLQIAPISRGSVAEYQALRRRLEQMAGHLNGEHAGADWSPIRYVNRNYDRATLAGFYRTARIGLVTPLRDGMNLVAKEYVASQDPSNPGVLVLSRFAGAAAELTGALIINPHDRQGMVMAIQRAASMSLAERTERWQECMSPVLANNVQHWSASFLSALSAITHQARTTLVKAA